MSGPSIGIVLGAFHRELVEKMLEEGRKTAKAEGLIIAEEFWVPGSLEAPLALKRMIAKPQIQGVAVLGIIERGETGHGLVMGQAVFSAVIGLQLEFNKPIGVGILGPEILPDQIEPRLLPHARNAILAVKAML